MAAEQLDRKRADFLARAGEAFVQPHLLLERPYAILLLENEVGCQSPPGGEDRRPVRETEGGQPSGSCSQITHRRFAHPL
jgi:hypothetical protein